MGRLARPTRPPAGGAIIFYGSNAADRPPRAAWRGSSDGTVEEVAKGISSVLLLSSSTETLDHDSNLSGSTFISSGSEPEKIVDQADPSSPKVKPLTPVSKAALSSNAVAVLGLAKDVSEVFKNLPYIKSIAGLVMQIIQIVDDVRTCQDRCRELVEKVIIYARVIFEALRALKSPNTWLQDLQQDLLQISSILESIFAIMQSLITTSLVGRILRRDEILGRIQEQDRRLDTHITSFQLKSAIALRLTPARSASDDNIPAPNKPSHTRRFSNKLRSKPQIMFGREKEVSSVVDAILQQPPARIAILGSGGIGKTTVALSVLHDERVIESYGEERFFISCEAAESTDLLLNELASALDIAANAVTDQIINTILRRLREKPHILVLDNFETTWDPPHTRSDVEMLLGEITSVDSTTVIITLRGSQRPSGVKWSLNAFPPLQPVDLDAATSIFRTITHKVDEHALKLVQAVDRVPLAVTLLANLAAVDGESTEDIWRRWMEESTAMVENGLDRLNSLETSIRLSLSSPRMKQDPGAQAFLSLVSLLPEGMSNNIFHVCEKGLPSIVNVKKALSILRQNALVFNDPSGSIRVLSPIRLFILAHHPPTPEARTFIQDQFIRLARQGLSTQDHAIQKQLKIELGNIESMLVDSLNSSRPTTEVVEAILDFCHYTYVAGTGSSQTISLAIEHLQVVDASPSPGLSPNKKEKKRKVLPFRSLKLFRGATAPALVQQESPEGAATVNSVLKLRGDCLGCWGQILARQSKFDLAEEKLKLAIQFHVKAGDVAGQAYDLHNLGYLLSRNSKTLDEAQHKFQEASKLRDTIRDVAGKAYDLIGIGHVLMQRAKFSEAESAFFSALELFNQVGDEIGEASALSSLGTVAQSQSKHIDSEKYFTNALNILSKAGDIVGQAECLAGLACTHLLRSEFATARNFIERAMSLRLPGVDPDHVHLAGRVCIAEAKFSQAEVHLLQAMELHKKCGDELGEADDLQYLSSVSFFQGSVEKAIEETTKAFEIYHRRENLLGEADCLSFEALLAIRRTDLSKAEEKLEQALTLHKQVSSILGQAHDLQQLGSVRMLQKEYKEGISLLEEALVLHTSSGNVQGQADDHNKISEALMHTGDFNNAMTRAVTALVLHSQIGDTAGQGDDLYLQGCIFMKEDRLGDAESSLKKALELHKLGESIFGEARDKATLGIMKKNIYTYSDLADEETEEKNFQEISSLFCQARSVFELFDARIEIKQCNYAIRDLENDYYYDR